MARKKSDSATPAQGQPTQKTGRFRRFKWLNSIIEAHEIAKKSYPWLNYVLLAIVVVVFGAFLIVGFVIDSPVMWAIPGFLFGVMIALIVLVRLAERAAYAQIDGQPGAAAAVLQSLSKQKFFVTPAVAVSKNQDMIHRVVCRAGVVLVSEGPANRVDAMLATERRKTSRFVAEVPVLEIQVGSEAGQLALPKLSKKMRKLPKTMRPPQVTAVRRRMDALSTSPMPVPKGPMPTSARAAKRGGRPR